MTRLNVGIVQADCAANLFYAQELGAFEKAGLDVQTQSMPGERDRVHTGGGLTQILAQAVNGGGLDIGLANGVIVALARQAGVPLRYVAPATSVLPGPKSIYEVMVRQDSTLTPGPGCNGATVAINRLNNLQQVLMSEWLEMHRGDPRTLKFREVAFQDMGDALQDGSVDVILPTEPFGTIYSSFGKFIGNAFEGIGPRFMLLGWFATEGWLAAHPDEAQRFAGAMRQASEWANGHRDESAQMLANQPHTRVTVELARRMVRATYGLALDPAMIAPVLKLATKYGLLTAPLAAGDLIWPVASL